MINQCHSLNLTASIVEKMKRKISTLFNAKVAIVAFKARETLVDLSNRFEIDRTFISI